MDIVNLAPDMLFCRFQEHYEVNMLALLDRNSCLLIDSGVTPQGRMLAEELTKRGLTVALIINSHYHPDHINGNRFFPEAETWGSRLHENCQLPHQPPARTLAHGDTGEFGSYRLRFLEARGHCSHQLVTVINETWAHVGDMLMTGFDGQLWLPYIAPDGDISLYLQDLNMISELNLPTLLPSHGQAIDSPKVKADMVRNYSYYLEKLRELGPGSPPEKYLLDPAQIRFAWHQRNLDNLFGNQRIHLSHPE